MLCEVNSFSRGLNLGKKCHKSMRKKKVKKMRKKKRTKDYTVNEEIEINM